MKIRIYDANQRNEPKSGYGLMSSQYAKYLATHGHDICFFPDIDKEGEDVVLWIRPPHYVKYPEFDPKKKNVFFTMHETEVFTDWKSDWPQLLNKTAAVITPTEWNKEVFVKNGVTVPIYVVPLGVDTKVFHGAKTYQFSVLSLFRGLGSDSSRENWKDTISAYIDAFYNNHNLEVELNIKAYGINYDGYNEFLREKTNNLEYAKTPPINIIDMEILPESLNNLYSKHWLFVKNANREGWCLPLWEAISAGIRVARTDIPVFGDVNGAYNVITFPSGDEEALKNIMLDEFRRWKKQKGFINAFSWKNSSQKLEGILREIYDK